MSEPTFGIYWYGLQSIICAAIGLGASTLPASAAQIDMQGPPGSHAFGSSVAVLPNGNFVVTDPFFSNATASNIGAVYLYAPNGTLISTLTGSNANDYVGGRIVVVGNNNFVVTSSGWHNGSIINAGAVTWVDGTTGLNGVVTMTNSLVGIHSDDALGSGDVTVLANGNYVVSSWGNGLGAATWSNGSSGVTGIVSNTNSLVGTYPHDMVGYRVTALSNGNYVVVSPYWTNDGGDVPIEAVGAVTWGNGATGISGFVSATNSLIGSTANDGVGGAPPDDLPSGNGVVALSNGHYVVASSSWNNGPKSYAGAVTWCNGSAMTSGIVSAANSLIGSHARDAIGSHITALSNGNYAVASSVWNNGVPLSSYGAVTWGNGVTGTIGTVSTANSLVGTSADDYVGYSVVALSNGNYVVATPFWSNGVASVGAVTWVDGSQPTSDVVSNANSLVGTTDGDWVGYRGVTALSDGNYVIASPSWSNGIADGKFGAVTWANGTRASAGTISLANSLVGSTPGDKVGSEGAAALGDGNFAIASPYWNNGIAGSSVGAVTWGRPGSGTSGAISASASLVGVAAFDGVGYRGITAFTDGNYAVSSPLAITLANGRFRLKGTIQAWNSVIPGGSFDYDAVRHRLIVGRSTENIVSLFTMDQIFADDFDP